MNLPNKFIEDMKELLKDDFSKYIASLDSEKSKGIRINNLKISDEDFFKLIGQSLPKVPWSTSGYYIDNKDTFSKSPYYNAGLYYIQEPSAMSVASFLPIEENDFVLDLCSAPGGKATAICDKLNGTGFLVANDISPTRCKALIKNIELMGITNCAITSDTHKKLEEVFVNYFDKILVDAPCSGEGMFKTDTNAANNWNETTNEYYKQLQLDILNSAKNMLKGNGIISYSTCTFSIKENEMVIDEFLSTNKDFSVLKIDNDKYNFSNGLLNTPMNSQTNDCTRIFPHKVDGEGHFLCLLKRNSKETNDRENINYKPDKKLTQMISVYKRFEKDEMNISLEGKFISHENSLFLINENLIDFKKIRTMRSGFYIGDIKNEKFKPSQNLAMSLKCTDFKNSVNLDFSNINIKKYLNGETIIENCENGTVLVCLNNFPLGFGIASNGKIKNKIGKSML